MDIKDRIKDQVEYAILLHEEHDSPEGHFASGDDEEDVAMCEKICEDMQHNEYAWCCIEVRCYYQGEIFGNDFLGGCSYESKKGFMEGGYYEDMKDRALEELCTKLEQLQLTPSTKE